MIKSIFRVAVLCIMGLACCSSVAQTSQQIPVDKRVRIGKLDNGLTYYVAYNSYPKGQAEFYIAQKVGSIMEEENQRGLAHFLEHMCFNGTKNFPGNDIVKWCESVGIKFGYNLNAYTSIERTVYNISGVPTARESVQDSCLLILHDWADDLLLDGEEIDAERKVIHEEWRSQTSPSQRILEKLLPKMYPGSRYGYRLPIGTMEVVDNFPYQALRDYYEKWYRPDLQGIMIVGDIDVDRIEAKIKELFSPIKMPENPAERTKFQVEDNKEPIYAIGTDKELTGQNINIMFKHDAVQPSEKNSVEYLKRGYITSMVSSMINNRFAEISKKADCPFSSAGCYDGTFMVSDSKGAFSGAANAKENVCAAFEVLYRELLRAKRHGFVQSEMDRYREDFLAALENEYKNRNKIKSNTLVEEYVEHFLDNEPIPSVEDYYEIMRGVANEVTLEDANKKVAELVNPDYNVVVVAMLPEKQGVAVPTEEQLDAIIKKVNAEQIDAYVDNVKTEPLIAKLPKKGKIKKEVVNKQFDAKEWYLSNGVKVVLKKTDYKDDEVLFSATANGGTSVFPESEASNLKVLPSVLRSYSLGSYSNNDLQKYYAGKNFSMALSASDYSRAITGYSVPKDMKEMMEYVYMAFNGLGADADEYAAMVSSRIASIKQNENNPRSIFSKRYMESFYKFPRKQAMTVEDLEKANRERIVEMAKQMFSNAADFTFMFVGNFDEAVLRDLVEQYIATLPADAKKATKTAKLGLSMNKGTSEDNYTAKMEVPQVYAAIVCFGDAEYTSKNELMASMAGQIMSIRLNEKVREKEGATYSIGASCSLSLTGEEPLMMSVIFPMKPEKKDVVNKIIKDEFVAMTKNVDDMEMQKVKEFMSKQHAERMKVNSGWLAAMSAYEKVPVNTFMHYDEVLNSISNKDVEKFVADLLKQNNYKVVFLNPEN